MSKPWVAVTEDEANEQGMRHEHMKKALRHIKNPWAVIGFDTALLEMSANKAPSETLIRFREVFDGNQRESLKLVRHPIFRCLTLFERIRRNGVDNWHPICMFQGESVEDRLPEHLVRSDKMWEHLRGRIGEPREVSYQDLEFVEKCDMRKYGWEAVYKFLESIELAEEAETDRVFTDQIDDFLDHSFWAAMRDSQEHYSQPWSVRNVELKSSPDRYRIEEVRGASGNMVRVRTKIYGEEGDLNEMKALAEGGPLLEEYYDPTSASGRAANRILEIKNENYFRKHGVTLWEEATGTKPEGSKLNIKDSVARDSENRLQAKELLKLVKGATPNTEQTVEDWILELAKEKVPV